ncbi:MAG TPA: hypothetical protein PL072_05440 [Phycisphaerales bacterium]|nr:hypothetical protein [Phycisphaerales bacterium]
MADRTSAGLFGMFFNVLAKNPTEEHRQMALEVYRETRNYDFNDYQMYCDDALVTLGLARKKIDPEDGEERMFYGPEGEDSP